MGNSDISVRDTPNVADTCIATLALIRSGQTLFKGMTRARVQAYRGSMYSLFETQFGVRFAQRKRAHADASVRR